MCRAGGRRCKGSNASSRATQTARKQRSRANQALRQAKAAGDPEAIAAAQQRLDQANASVQAAKETAMRHHDHDHDNAADHGGDVTTSKPAPAPITGELSSKPLLDNTWGSFGTENSLHYHDDGPVGTAVSYMGQDARMDVDGEPLANVAGRIATDVVMRKTTAQQAVNDLKELRDRLPEGSRAKMCLSQAVRNMDGPDTPAPQVPDSTPEPLKDLVRKLHAVPMVRREPEKELQPLVDICERLAAGDRRTAIRLDDQVEQLRNLRHESLGDCGKFEIDAAVKDAVTALEEHKRQQREQKPTSPAGQPGDVTPPAGVRRAGESRADAEARDWNDSPLVKAGLVKPRPMAGQQGDVTEGKSRKPKTPPRTKPEPPKTSAREENTGQQADDRTRQQQQQRKSQRRRRVEHGDVHIGNFTQSGTHVHSQTEVNHAPMTFNVTTSPRDTSGRTRRDVADGTEHTGVQIGLNFGSINTSRADDQD